MHEGLKRFPLSSVICAPVNYIITQMRRRKLCVDLNETGKKIVLVVRVSRDRFPLFCFSGNNNNEDGNSSTESVLCFAV